jgi:hypothetical protein
MDPTADILAPGKHVTVLDPALAADVPRPIHDRRPAKRVVGIFLRHVRRAIQDEAHAPLVILLVNLRPVDRVVAHHNFVSLRSVDCPATPVPGAVPLGYRIPLVVGEERRYPTDGSADAPTEAIVGSLHASAHQLVLGIVGKSVPGEIGRLIEVAVVTNRDRNWRSYIDS